MMVMTESLLICLHQMEGSSFDGLSLCSYLLIQTHRFIKTIRSWRGEHLNDEFAFSWTIDRSIKSGRYFIELYSEDDGDDDDVSRSFIFEVDAGSSRPTGGRKPVRGGAGAGRGGKGF